MNSEHFIFEQLDLQQSYRNLPACCYSEATPQPLHNAHLISFNPAVAVWLGWNPCQLHPESIAFYFGGKGQLAQSQPLAMKYTGHQFGTYNPQLGDGRGVLLGEYINPQGLRLDLHLKGAGQTAYSRFGDGRAVLRSSIREYLASEAMHALKIPSTRALSLVGSDDMVMRDGEESCAAVLRVTACHLRFGHFEHLYYTQQHKALRELADYCLERYFPDLQQAEDSYLSLFIEVRNRSAQLVARWQAYGFVHGVLNTDNMSIIGETFDYGPFTFLDAYDPQFVSNKNDHEGRYAFEKQPDIVLWNLACLAQAFVPLTDKTLLIEALNGYREVYFNAYYDIMRKRLGLLTEHKEDVTLVNKLVLLAEQESTDLTRFLRQLCFFSTDRTVSFARYSAFFNNVPEIYDWLGCYRQRLMQEAASRPIRSQQMKSVNPVYILRNYMLEEAIQDAQKGDYRTVNTLLCLMRRPFEQQVGFERFEQAPPDWAADICLTCSS